MSQFYYAQLFIYRAFQNHIFIVAAFVILVGIFELERLYNRLWNESPSLLFKLRSRHLLFLQDNAIKWENFTKSKRGIFLTNKILKLVIAANRLSTVNVKSLLCNFCCFIRNDLIIRKLPLKETFKEGKFNNLGF